MNVVQRSPERLVLRERPWLEGFVGLVFLAAGLFAAFTSTSRAVGASFALLGAGVLLVATRVVTCTFDRPRGRFVRVSRGLIGASEIEKPVADIVSVWVERSSGGRSVTYRVELAMTSGERVRLTPGSSGKAQKEAIATEIRAFLHLPEPVPLPVPTFGDIMSLAFGHGGPGGNGGGMDVVIANRQAEISRNPDDVDAHIQLAAALAMVHRGDDARAMLESARARYEAAGRTALVERIDPVLTGMRKALDRRP